MQKKSEIKKANYNININSKEKLQIDLSKYKTFTNDNITLKPFTYTKNDESINISSSTTVSSWFPDESVIKFYQYNQPTTTFYPSNLEEIAVGKFIERIYYSYKEKWESLKLNFAHQVIEQFIKSNYNTLLKLEVYENNQQVKIYYLHNLSQIQIAKRYVKENLNAINGCFDFNLEIDNNAFTIII